MDACKEYIYRREPKSRGRRFDIQSSASDVSNPDIQQVGAAYRALQNEVDSIPGGRNTVGDASDKVSANAKDLQQSWEKLYGSLQCGA